MKSVLLSTFAAASLLCAAGAGAADSAHYHLVHTVPLPGDDGWDYISNDSANGRIFVAHGTKVQLVDSTSLAVIGELPAEGVHGVAVAPDLGRGYISAGRANTLIVFDLKSLQVIARVRTTGENPDAVLYEPTTHRVFTFNGKGRNVTAIDASTNEVLGSIPVDAKPEFAATDGAGHVFVNLEDKNAIAVIDPQKLTVTAVWPLSECDSPTGLALDRTNHRLFSTCDKVMAVVDATSGQLVARVPTGDGVDAVAFDPDSHLIFASGGDGTLTIVKEAAANKFNVVQTVKTKLGARTMTIDPRSHRVFLTTAKLGPRPAATAEQPHPRPAILPGTFELLVFEP